MKTVFFLFTVCLLVACGTGTPRFSITPDKADDTITYEWAGNAATFDITSPGGIGGARIVRTGGSTPNKIVLQLRLRGLESLKFRYANNEVTVSVPSSGAHTVNESARLNGGTAMEVAPASEYWMPVEIVSVSETIPLVDGYFRVELPPAYYASGANEFSLEWIDFFR